MSTKTKQVTEKQAKSVLAAVAAWLATKGYGTPICPHKGQELHATKWYAHTDGTDCEGQTYGPAPTGPEAARMGEGPMLLMEWDWPSSGPTPSIILEGGPEDWAMDCCFAVQEKIGKSLFVEPYSSYALCIYPGDA